MKTSGLIFLIVSWSFILGMLVYCFYRVFSAKRLD